tara:strand:- start:17142 stop:21704 length:4563 start_codon:yes stop_codon:yes gene_type:complete
MTTFLQGLMPWAKLLDIRQLPLINNYLVSNKNTDPVFSSDEVKAEPQPTDKIGIEDSWHKAENSKLCISTEEWEKAKSIMYQQSTTGLAETYMISRKQHPELNHSFIVMQTEQGPKLGAVARAKYFTDSQGNLIKEGIIAHGKSCLIKTIQWEDGSSDVVRIANKSKNNANKIMAKKMGYHLGGFVVKRSAATRWITGKNGIKTIQDKEYTIMKHLPGVELGSELGNINSRHQKIAVGLEAAKAILSLQEKNIVHGDIHPGNLLIDEEGQIIPIDFDLSFALQDGQETKVTGKARGSRRYMAPEIGVWKKNRDATNRNDGHWAQHDGVYSYASDIYALGVLFERDLKLGQCDDEMKHLISRMKSKNPAQRPDIQEVLSRLAQAKSLNESPVNKYFDLDQESNPDAKAPITISVGQALLLLIDRYQDTEIEKTKQLKTLYLNGFKTQAEKSLLTEWLNDSVLEEYHVSKAPEIINHDASRRYFETHLSINSSQSALESAQLKQLKLHYQSIKDCFEGLGGDIDAKVFKKSGKRVLKRDYAKEQTDRLTTGGNPDDLIKGISTKEQESIDRLFSGQIADEDYDMHKEYADMINRIQNNPEYSDELKEKALLIVKSTRLSMILSTKIQKYNKKGLYDGEDLPGNEIYQAGIYEGDNRGRVSKPDGQESTRAGHLGIMQGHMPLAGDDAALSEEAFCYFKPSDRSTYSVNANWTNYAMEQLVHPFSNSISGTLLVQMKMMMKLHDDGNLQFKDKAAIENYFKSMISTMSAVSGGHSLLEFTGPFLLKDIQDKFKFIDGFADISLRSMFLENNDAAFEKSLQDTILYNNQLLHKAKLHQELKASVEQEKDLSIHGVARNGNTAQMQKLLLSGSDPALENARGQCALDIAVEHNNTSLILLLLSQHNLGNIKLSEDKFKNLLVENAEIKQLHLKHKKDEDNVRISKTVLSKRIDKLLQANEKLNNHATQEEITAIRRDSDKIHQELIQVEQALFILSKQVGFYNLADALNPYLDTAREFKTLNSQYRRALAELQNKRNNIKGGSTIEDIVDTAEQLFPEVPTIGSMGVLMQYLSKRADKTHKTSIPEKLEPENFSFLDSRNIYQTPAVIGAMMEATKQSPIDLVAFRPERQLLQDVSAYVTVYLKTADEQTRNEVVEKVVAKLKPEVKEKLSDLYNNLESKVSERMKLIIQGDIRGNCHERAAVCAAQKISFPIPYCAEISNVQQLATKIETQRAYQELLGQKLDGMITQYFRFNPFYQYKSSADNQEPVVMFVGGGQASGKGSSIGNLMNDAKNAGLEPNNLVYLNNDSYKSLLKFDDSHPKLFSQLTHDEARLIRDKAFKMAKESNMHLLMDQVSLSRSATNYALRKNSVVKGTIVSTKVESAIERSYQRALETGRFEDTVGLLECHQAVPNKALAYIDYYKGKKVQVNFADNNVDAGQAPVLFMSVDCASSQIVIHNEDLLREFVKKQLINTSAKTPSEVYPFEPVLTEQLDEAVETYLEQLNAMGYQIEQKNKSKLTARMGA